MWPRRQPSSRRTELWSQLAPTAKCKRKMGPSCPCLRATAWFSWPPRRSTSTTSPARCEASAAATPWSPSQNAKRILDKRPCGCLGQCVHVSYGAGCANRACVGTRCGWRSQPRLYHHWVRLAEPTASVSAMGPARRQSARGVPRRPAPTERLPSASRLCEHGLEN